MKKPQFVIFILVSFVIILTKAVFLSAAPERQTDKSASQEFKFTLDVFQAIHQYAWGVENYDISGEDLTTLMAGIIEQNNHLKTGQNILKDYLKNKDDLYYPVALGISKSFELIIEKNEVVLDTIRGISNNEQNASQDLNYKMAELISTKKQAGQLIVASLGGLIQILVEPARSNPPKGPIHFKISQEEKEALLTRINKLFGDKLKEYDEYNKLRNENKKGDPEALTWTAIGISHIRNTLSCVNYEDWENTGNP
jgi:hypothetical protein